MSTLAFAVGLILCTASIWFGFKGEKFMGRPMGGDFVELYATAVIAGPDAYDTQRIAAVEHAVLPEWPRDQMLAYHHAPWFAAALRPLAALPYRMAYCAWLLVAFGIYTAAILLLFPVAGIPRQHRATAFLLAVSAAPFLFETWIGGQVSVLGFLSLALLLRLRHESRPFLAGMLFALCTYSPGIARLPLVVLALLGEWTILAGFLAGSAALVGVSFATFGAEGLRNWIESLRYTFQLTTGPFDAFRRFKYVDAHSFTQLFFGPAIASKLLAAALALSVITRIVVTTCQLRRAPVLARNLLLAAALAATPIAGIYTPIYDIALLPAAALLPWPGIRTLALIPREAFVLFLSGLYLIPWVTQSLAEILHLQILTPFLAVYALWLCAQATHVAEATTTPRPLEPAGASA